MPTTVFEPSADTWINDDSPSTNYGSSSNLSVNDTDDKILMRFDLSSIDDSYLCTSATLTLRAFGEDSIVTATVYKVAAANGAWTELGATWNKIDGSADWAGSAGCSTADTDYDSDDIGSAARSSVYNSATWEIDLDTETVTSWFGGSNDGIVIILTGAATMRSRDLSSPSSNRPKLSVTYVYEPDPAVTTAVDVPVSYELGSLSVTPDPAVTTAVDVPVSYLVASIPPASVPYLGNVFMETRSQSLSAMLLATSGENWTVLENSHPAPIALRATRLKGYLLPV